MARKPKYNKEVAEQICGYIKSGDSQKIACIKAGISCSTFYEWIKSKSELADSVKKAKEEFQETIIGKLEASLWKRAMGYEVKETETEYVEDVGNKDKPGKPKIKSQKVRIKHIQPDTGALIFALTNVAPEKWVNRQKTEIQEVKKPDAPKNDKCFENLPADVLVNIANQLQDAQFNIIKDGKEDDQ